ncbi:hypothetical protein [Candidatus Hodgkinia cicadicola]|uniref:hypothetical protein n=1 Tax=Candidatus Hodgkinia cicadicola TaxID=573658 RepID=UPI0011BA4EA4
MKVISSWMLVQTFGSDIRPTTRCQNGLLLNQLTNHRQLDPINQCLNTSFNIDSIVVNYKSIVSTQHDDNNMFGTTCCFKLVYSDLISSSCTLYYWPWWK